MSDETKSIQCEKTIWFIVALSLSSMILVLILAVIAGMWMQM